MFHWRVCVCLFSDLDRDFWNNNDSSSVQQRWSSYPPKEFVLNISPYAPYGDPRLSLKWVSVQAGKRHQPLTLNSYHTQTSPNPNPYQPHPRFVLQQKVWSAFVHLLLFIQEKTVWLAHAVNWPIAVCFVVVVVVFFCQKIILMVDKMQVAFHFNIQNRTRSKTESINCMFSDHIWIIWVFISLMIVSPLRSVKNFLLMQKNMRILQH